MTPVSETNSTEQPHSHANLFDRPVEDPQAGFLNVIFHGAFCFFECLSEILVRVPFVPTLPPSPGVSDHTYRAGFFLGETTFPPSTYKLEDVEPGFARFPRERNIFVQGGKPKANPGADMYAEMHFPYPDAIHSIQTLAVEPSTQFGGSAMDLATVMNVKMLATIQVFTYRFKNHKKLRLGVLPWRADGTMVGGFTTLHLFAESEVPVHKMSGPGGHVRRTFDASVKMFEGLGLTMLKDQPVDLVKQADVPYGVRIEELQDLAPRLGTTMRRLGRLKRQGGENLDKAFQDSQTDGSSAELCASVVGGS